MISYYFAVGLGGAIGAVARMILAKSLPPTFLELPLQILCVNVLGCFLMGCLTKFMVLYGPLPNYIKDFLAAGCLGGFTTFSAFALEFGMLYEKHLYMSAILYAILSFSLSLFLFFVGIKIVR